jgi:hypothetical protein
MVAQRCSEAAAESGGWRQWQQGPAVVGGRGEGEDMAMRWENG